MGRPPTRRRVWGIALAASAAHTCTEDDCDAQVPDSPDYRCGGTDDLSLTEHGCTELYCGDHLWATDRDGYLCAADWQETCQ